ncbi:MAG: nitroreductase/quinone reductase family protein [Acidimicrobiales bacterium]
MVDTTDDLLAFGRAVTARFITGLHEGVFRASGGEVLGTVLGMPVVLVTTTGRRTGKRHSTLLTAPVLDDARIVLVASNGGSDKHPAWYHNIQATPEVSVLRGGRERAMRGRVASATERTELWPEVVARYAGYGLYQGRTDREIPLVILEV